ncbi:YobH family protein [Siccibacter colletis]|uniref:YobH family protein n=1 Tax=Siccibacter colletis TaxID=1505757 RepID=UPI0028BF0E94|nr:YobH family protein [Siccibacter colletis]WNN47046.1 YobH family protein [Siccibacter colletis]
MRLIIRTGILLALIWLAMLLSGYGVLIGSQENVAGLGLQCKYLTARQVVTAQYIHSDSGVIGLSDCPVLRQSGKAIDRG